MLESYLNGIYFLTAFYCRMVNFLFLGNRMFLVYSVGQTQVPWHACFNVSFSKSPSPNRPSSDTPSDQMQLASMATLLRRDKPGKRPRTT